jgi:transposase
LMVKKQPTLTIEEIARRCGVPANTIYQAMARVGKRESNPLSPLLMFGRDHNIGDTQISQVQTLIRHEGVPGLKRLAKLYGDSQRGRFAQLILSSTDTAVVKAIAENEKLRKKKTSGVHAGMSKGKA